MKKRLSYILMLLLVFFTNILSVFSSSIQQSLIDVTKPDISDLGETKNGIDLLLRFAKWFKSELLSIVWILAIGIFIFIGMKIVMARGNPEEFKKSMMHFVYALIGIFFIFIAWGLVNIVSRLSL